MARFYTPNDVDQTMNNRLQLISNLNACVELTGVTPRTSRLEVFQWEAVTKSVFKLYLTNLFTDLCSHILTYLNVFRASISFGRKVNCIILSVMMHHLAVHMAHVRMHWMTWQLAIRRMMMRNDRFGMAHLTHVCRCSVEIWIDIGWICLRW